MRRAFTLIELLVICAILATMVSIGVGSILSGQGTARVKGATRDVYAAIRHARSVALVTGQRVLVNYSNEKVDDETCVKIEVVAAKIMNADGDRPEPQPYYVMDYKELAPKAKAGEKYELVHIRKPGEGEAEKPETAGGGETLTYSSKPGRIFLLKTSESKPRLSSTSRIFMFCDLIQLERFVLTAVEIKGRKEADKDLAKPPFLSSQAIPFIVPTILTSSLRGSKTIKFISPEAPISRGTPKVGSINLTLLSVPHLTAI